MRRPLAVLLAFVLIGCGGGGGSSGTHPAVMPPQQPTRPVTLPEAPLQRIVDSRQAPIWSISNNSTSIGAKILPPRGQLNFTETVKDIDLLAGVISDGAGTISVVDYLKEVSSRQTGLSTFRSPPTIRIAEGTNSEFVDYTIRAVQFINAHLPYEKRLRVSSRPAPELNPLRNVQAGEIHINFEPKEFWPGSVVHPGSIGVAIYQTRSLTSLGMARGTIWIDSDIAARADTSSNYVVHTVVHEILHAIGFTEHTNPRTFPQSVLNPEIPNTIFPFILGPTDGEALLAAYTRLRPGARAREISPFSLGDWEDRSVHIRGDVPLGNNAIVAFGARARNGLFQPWAAGPTPWTNLQGNPVLSGNVSWDGVIMGFTRDLFGWGGEALLSVNLVTLDGQIDFTNLEKYSLSRGVSSVWGDGDLRYFVRVRENAFTQYGGDSGEVTGAFFGRRHEGMAGVLERHDLSAAFGGKR